MKWLDVIIITVKDDYCEKYEKTPRESNRERYCYNGGGCDKCFLTTAMCKILCKPDDCFELTSMRNIRDDQAVNKYLKMIDFVEREIQ